MGDGTITAKEDREQVEKLKERSREFREYVKKHAKDLDIEATQSASEKSEPEP